MSEVTQLLNAIDAGDPKAADQLLPLVDGGMYSRAACKRGWGHLVYAGNPVSNQQAADAESVGGNPIAT